MSQAPTDDELKPLEPQAQTDLSLIELVHLGKSVTGLEEEIPQSTVCYVWGFLGALEKKSCNSQKD